MGVDIAVVFAMVAMLGVGLFVAILSNSEKVAAKKAYDEALAAYRRAPHDVLLRQNALRQGRKYSRRTRNGDGVAMFDEAALRNDLDSVALIAPTMAKAPEDPSIEERLRKLTDLHERGVISGEEHAARRAEILREI
ncbi:MAG: SHOCT domain-containing protein [Fimbriimonas sp.]